MEKDLNINIVEVTRIEGHGNIVIDVKKGRIKELRFDIIESPRFFEAMLRGRRYDEAHHIMSRICGICAVSHTSASLKAIESAMGIRISRQAALLRRLAFSGEMLQSHILHLFFLVLPDLVGAGSIIPLLESHPELARRALGLKRLSNDICAAVAGRHIHPISLVPGGVAHTPRPQELKTLKKRLEDSFGELEALFEFLSGIPAPEFRLEREFISLKARGEYAAYAGEPFSSMGYPMDTASFRERIKEYVAPHSVAKHARSPKGTYMVGALSRVNNNLRQLRPTARAMAKRAGLVPPLTNPFQNNMAQLVECFHMTEDAVAVIDKLLETGPRPEPLKKPSGYGTGIGMVEAPRGTLYHEYTVNKAGIVERAECIIPTAQNLRSIEDDLRGFVPGILHRPKKEISGLVESLVRAYDPCISCSTHMMDVRFV